MTAVDAYFIDVSKKIIYFVQSKFRQSERNFEEKGISSDELLAMDLTRMLNGEAASESGNPYNGKIQAMVREIKKIPDIGRYRYQVIVLANAKGLTKANMIRLTGGFPAELIDHEVAYSRLLFPLLTGTYYTAEELHLSLMLSDKSPGAKISYSVLTEATRCDITVVFVPTLEIAKTMYKYRNSILRYNPRSYLAHEGRRVNEEIRNTILARSTNEFALFNNGITILSDETSLNERIGQKDRAQLSLLNPQIINGGQTAYTLSLLYAEDPKSATTTFAGKEVLVKIITFESGQDVDEEKRISLIEAISRATNQQTAVSEVDRRSNAATFKQIQNRVFERTGLLLERKRGEFDDGIREGYVRALDVMERTLFFRAAVAIDGDLTAAVRKGRRFVIDYESMANASDEKYDRYSFAAKVLKGIVKPHKLDSIRIDRSLLGVIVYASHAYFPKLGTRSQINDAAELAIAEAQREWTDFREYCVSASLLPPDARKSGRKLGDAQAILRYAVWDDWIKAFRDNMSSTPKAIEHGKDQSSNGIL